jgi:hypothetical protein
MSPELINAVTSVGTLLLLAATVIAAIVQLRHLRAGNELAAALAIERDFRRSELQGALSHVQSRLAAQLEEPAYRARLGAPGYLDPREYPEMLLCNWFDRVGSLIRGGFLNESMFLTSFDRLVMYYWELLAPLIAVLRRTRGAGEYAGFEFLAFRAQARHAERRAHARPASTPHAVADPWLEHDTNA